MDQNNLEFLTDQIKYTGFGETLENVLKEKMQAGETAFIINHEVKFGSDSLRVDLNFKKSDQSDMYFFNSYKVNFQKEGAPQGLEQLFYINKDNNITMKEAYNLLDGRAVNKDLRDKEGQLYNSWIQINFKDAESNGNFKLNHYHQNYGYDLEAALAKHPIKELNNSEYKDNLISSLKKGNVQSVTFTVEGSEKKQFVEANPQFKTINIYDGNMKRINNRESKDEKQSESEGKNAAKNQKQEIDSNSGETGSKENKIRKKKVNSI